MTYQDQELIDEKIAKHEKESHSGCLSSFIVFIAVIVMIYISGKIQHGIEYRLDRMEHLLGLPATNNTDFIKIGNQPFVPTETK